MKDGQYIIYDWISPLKDLAKEIEQKKKAEEEDE